MNPAGSALFRLLQETGIPHQAIARLPYRDGAPPRHGKSEEARRLRDQVAWLLRHDRRFSPVQLSWSEIATAMGWARHQSAIEAAGRHQDRLDASPGVDDGVGTPHAGV